MQCSDNSVTPEENSSFLYGDESLEGPPSDCGIDAPIHAPMEVSSLDQFPASDEEIAAAQEVRDPLASWCLSDL